jgi:hypothetical protein
MSDKKPTPDYEVFVKCDYDETNFDCQGSRLSGVLNVELAYPRRDIGPRKFDTVEVGLNDTRAADGLRIKFDFDRNGWAIEQQLWWKMPDRQMCDEVDHWYEVAFVPAWGQQRTMTQEQMEAYYKTNELPAPPAEPLKDE